jgi:hypothetical protein
MVALPQTYTAKVVIVVVYDGGLGICQVHLFFLFLFGYLGNLSYICSVRI